MAEIAPTKRQVPQAPRTVDATAEYAVFDDGSPRCHHLARIRLDFATAGYVDLRQAKRLRAALGKAIKAIELCQQGWA